MSSRYNKEKQMSRVKKIVWQNIFQQLQKHFADFCVKQWWGTSDPFERMVGSVLVQNTTWTNADRALQALVAHDLLSPEKLASQSQETLMAHIRPAGFQIAKSKALLTLASWVVAKRGMAGLQASAEATERLRSELIGLKGIGPETADTILLYTLNRPTIAGDAYTRRLAERLTGKKPSYEQVRRDMMEALPEADDLQSLHGLIIELGKAVCQKRRPQCHTCPLQTQCTYAAQETAIIRPQEKYDLAPGSGRFAPPEHS